MIWHIDENKLRTGASLYGRKKAIFIFLKKDILEYVSVMNIIKMGNFVTGTLRLLVTSL